MSIDAVYAPTETCEIEEMFYVKINSVLEQCLRFDALIVLATLILSLKLRELAKSYMLSPMALVPGMTTALSESCKMEKAENCRYTNA